MFGFYLFFSTKTKGAFAPFVFYKKINFF